MDQKKITMIQLSLGIALVVAAGILMFLGVMPLTSRIVLGLVGIALIASARFGIQK
jgi:hypothetical protein